MAVSDVYGWVTPDYLDDADGPEQLAELVRQIETLLTTGTLKMSGGVIEANTPTAPNHPVTLGHLNARFRIGPAADAPPAGGLPDGSIYFGID